MKTCWIIALLLASLSPCQGQRDRSPARLEAEYYVAAYAEHYGVPIALVHAVITRESNWRACAISSKGAVGLMQLMPVTARRFGVQEPCDQVQNISGGVRYLALLMQQFQNDFRLVMAAYYAGEKVIGRRGLAYRNPDVVAYVKAIRSTYIRELANRTDGLEERDMR